MNTSEFIVRPIGIIETSFNEVTDSIPIQGTLHSNSKGKAKLFDEYIPGLKDLDGFSHAFLLYYFHLSDRVKLQSAPYMDTKPHGVFAIRSPHRPNHIGQTLVKIEKIDKGVIFFAGADMVNGTPLLDIKPFNPMFDNCEHVKTGWMSDKQKNMKNIMVRSTKQWLHEPDECI